MADELDPSTSLPPETLVEAKGYGWADREHWRGNPADWVDADEFLRRTRQVLPLVRKENDRLRGELQQTNATLAELRDGMQNFVKFQQELTIQRLEEQRRELLAARREARDEGNDTRLEEIEVALDENSEAKKKAQAAPPPPPPKTPPIAPELAAWQAENPWFGTDKRKTGLAMGLAQEAEEKGLKGKAYFDFIDAEMAQFLSPARIDEGKLEGGGPSGGGAPRGGSGYASLPPEAKAQCDREEARFVGPNKPFKDQAAWRKHWVALYNA